MTDLIGTIRRETHQGPDGKPNTGWSLWCLVARRTYPLYGAGDLRNVWLCLDSTASGNVGEYLQSNKDYGWVLVREGVYVGGLTDENRS